MGDLNIVVFVGIQRNDEDSKLYCAAENVADRILFINDISEFSSKNVAKYCLVTNDFESESFMASRHTIRSIISPKMFMDHVKQYNTLPCLKRPTYNKKLKNVVISFSIGFDRDIMGKYVSLLHNMSALVKKIVSEDIQIIISQRADSSEASQGSAMGISVLADSWITESWKSRDDDNFDPLSEDFMMKHQIKCFHGLYIALFGLSSEDDLHHYIDLIGNYDGFYVEMIDCNCTHVVVFDDYADSDIPLVSKLNAVVVSWEWFWKCIQINMYVNVNSYLVYLTNTQPRDKKQRFTLAELVEERPNSQLLTVNVSIPSENSIDDKNKVDLPHTTVPSPSSVNSNALCKCSGVSSASESKGHQKPPSVAVKTKRHCLFDEIYNAEINYCSVLEFLGQNMYSELSQMVGDPRRELISSPDISYIFGTIIRLYEIHRPILNELTEIAANWNDKAAIGEIYIKRIGQITTEYSRFSTKYKDAFKLVKNLMVEKPRFMAFIKLKESFEMSGRQKFSDLYIKPIQRLPQTILLMQEMLKYTPEKFPDHSCLTKAVSLLKDSLLKINRFCAENEDLACVLDLINDISKCPTSLQSSSRKLFMKIKVTELSNLLVKEGDEMIICVFNDYLELCKCRRKINIPGHKQTKPYKHIALLPHSFIRRIVFVDDNDYVFALVWQSINSMSELICAFSLIREEMSDCEGKKKVIDDLARHIGNSTSCSNNSLILHCGIDNLPSNIIQSKFSRLTHSLTRMFSFGYSDLKSFKAPPESGQDMNTARASLNYVDEFETTSLFSYDSSVFKRISRRESINGSAFSLISDVGSGEKSKKSGILRRIRHKKTI